MKRQNRIGQKFNKLTILSISQNDNKVNKVKYLCICDCGNKREVYNNNLIYGKTRSCGCIQKERTAQSNRNLWRKPLGSSSFHNLYNCYIKRAKKINIEFKLSKDSFKLLTKENCYYCGIKPKNKHKVFSKDKNWQEANAYIYNGLDRINSKFGYIINNIVPCCKQCNQGKMDYSVKDFFTWIKRVYEHSKSQYEIELVIERIK